ncbi:MAG: hypothetical protein WBA17_13890 [Saprospiraceae bacterium]
MSRLFPLLLLLSVGIGALVAQERIVLRNPSFEGEPADATVPVDWLAATPGTTPDILPGYWGVFQEANEGDTYVGLITRANGTWEAISQRLPKTLPAKECYNFTVDLAWSRAYAGYNGQIKLRIYGGTTKDDRRQLLYESETIDHTAWRTYPVEFILKKPVNYLIFEAFYSDRPFRHEGNILMDNITFLQRCPRA